MKLSIAMIVKNEENNIERTLKALSGLNEKLKYEIIVVDTGSTDKTMDIAKKYTDRIYEHKWSGNFAEMRNISIKYCTGEWILILDADEVLENPNKLINFLNSEKGELFNAATVNILNYDRSKKTISTQASLARLFRNDSGVEYCGRVHEQPKYKLPLAHTDISFKHYGYCSDDYDLMIYKFERNKELLEEELKTAKGENKIYTLFQLSKTYSMAKNENEALRYIKKAYDEENAGKRDSIHSYVYHWYASMLFNRKEYQDAIKICLEFEKYGVDNLDIFYILAVSYTSLCKYSKAYKYYEKYFKLREKRKNGEYNEDLSLSEASFNNYNQMILNKIICYYNEKKYDRVISYYEKHRDEDLEEKAEMMYVYSCMITGKLTKITEFYKDKEIKDSDISMILADYKRIYVNEYVDNVQELRKVISSLDSRLRIYFDCVDDGKCEEAKKVDFAEFYEWKQELLRKLILEDVNNVSLIKGESNELIKCYISKVCEDFEVLSKVVDYTEKRFLTTDIKELNFICSLENVLVVNKSIMNNKYRKLILRILANKSLFRSIAFNNDALKKDEIRYILDEFDKMWFDLEDEVKLYSDGRVDYLKRLGKMFNLNKKYSAVVKVFIHEVTDEPISPEMLAEKENVFSAVENLISLNNMKEAEAVLEQLENVFKWDGKIFGYKGVLNYSNGKFDAALLDLALAEILLEDKFDPIFNIACVMERLGRKKDSKFFYNKAYNLCADTEMKRQIKEIVDSLN